MDIYRANIKEFKKLGKKNITPMELVHFVNRKDMYMIITYMYQYTILNTKHEPVPSNGKTHVLSCLHQSNGRSHDRIDGQVHSSVPTSLRL